MQVRNLPGEHESQDFRRALAADNCEAVALDPVFAFMT